MGVTPLPYITSYGPSMAAYLMCTGHFWPAWYFKMSRPTYRPTIVLNSIQFHLIQFPFPLVQFNSFILEIYIARHQKPTQRRSQSNYGQREMTLDVYRKRINCRKHRLSAR